MVSRIVKAVALVMVMGGLTLPMSAQAQEGGVSHYQFARDLALRLGLSIPNTATPEDIFGLLIAEGLVPKDGWNSNKTLTVGDFARVIVQTLERASGDQLVPADARGDDNAFIEAAKAADFSLESIEQTLSGVGTLTEKTGPGANRENTTTDPTDSRTVFGDPDERAGGTDVSIATTFPNNNILDALTPPAPQTVTPAPTSTGGGTSTAAEVAAAVSPAAVDRVLRSLPPTVAPTTEVNPN